MIPDGSINLRNDLGIDDTTKNTIDETVATDFGVNIAEFNKVDLVQHYVDIVSGAYGGGISSSSNQPQSTKVKSLKKETSVAKNSLFNEPAAVSNSVRTKVYSIISEKTGYPPLMIEDTLSLKADLGIDDATKEQIVNEITSQLSGNAVDMLKSISVGDILHALSGESLPEPEVTEKPKVKPKIKIKPMDLLKKKPKIHLK